MSPFKFLTMEEAKAKCETYIKLTKTSSGSPEMEDLSKALNKRKFTDILRRKLNEKRADDNQLPEMRHLDSISTSTLDAIDEAYVKHVRPSKLYMGTAHQQFLSSMEKYRDAVVHILEDATLDFVDVGRDDQSLKQNSALNAPARAYVSLTYLPGFPIPKPFPTNSVIVDIQETLEPYQEAIAEVSTNAFDISWCATHSESTRYVYFT